MRAQRRPFRGNLARQRQSGCSASRTQHGGRRASQCGTLVQRGTHHTRDRLEKKAQHHTSQLQTALVASLTPSLLAGASMQELLTGVVTAGTTGQVLPTNKRPRCISSCVSDSCSLLPAHLTT